MLDKMIRLSTYASAYVPREDHTQIAWWVTKGLIEAWDGAVPQDTLMRYLKQLPNVNPTETLTRLKNSFKIEEFRK